LVRGSDPRCRASTATSTALTSRTTSGTIIVGRIASTKGVREDVVHKTSKLRGDISRRARWQQERRSRLTGADVESLLRDSREGFDERRAERNRQRRAAPNSLVVQCDREPVLQERADDCRRESVRVARLRMGVHVAAMPTPATMKPGTSAQRSPSGRALSPTYGRWIRQTLAIGYPADENATRISSTPRMVGVCRRSGKPMEEFVIWERYDRRS